MAPTAGDTVTVATAFDLTCDAAPSTSDETILKATVVSSSGRSSDEIMNFVVTSTRTGRLRRRRGLLATYTWVVTFDFVISLSAAGYASTDAFTTAVTSDLADVYVSLDSALTSVSVSGQTEVTAVATTRSPTPQPTPGPQASATTTTSYTSNNNDDGDGNDDGFWGLSSGDLSGLFVALGITVVVGVAGFSIYQLNKSHSEYIGSSKNDVSVYGASSLTANDYDVEMKATSKKDKKPVFIDSLPSDIYIDTQRGQAL